MAVPGRSVLSSVYMRQTLLSEFRSGCRPSIPRLPRFVNRSRQLLTSRMSVRTQPIIGSQSLIVTIHPVKSTVKQSSLEHFPIASPFPRQRKTANCSNDNKFIGFHQLEFSWEQFYTIESMRHLCGFEDEPTVAALDRAESYGHLCFRQGETERC